MKLSSGVALAGVAFTATVLLAPFCYGQDQQPPQQPAQPAQESAQPAQESAQPQEAEPKDMHLVTFGPFGRYILNGTLQGNSSTKTVDVPSSTIDYNNNATPQRYDFGPVLEFRLSSHFSVVAEGAYHPVSYKITATTTYNAPVPRGVTLSTVQETTKARVFEVPVMVKFRNLGSGAVLSHAFFEAGGAMRFLTNIKSTTVQTYSDSTTKTNNSPITPITKTAKGLVAGAGLRFTDELGIHVTPEARYTHWFGSNIDSVGVAFPKSQVEVCISFSF